MTRLWILQTNERSFLDDCRDFEAYGVRAPSYMRLLELLEGDTLLLRLRTSNTRAKPCYLGPYLATSEPRFWVENIEGTQGVWQKIGGTTIHSPRWLARFPWCVFLLPTKDFVNELRQLTVSDQIRACIPIPNPVSERVLQELGCNLNETHPASEPEAGRYRTTRGVYVRSRAEHMIDNWFTDHRIMAHYESAIYLDDRRIVPDWYLPSLNVYVEYLGRKGDPEYEKMWKLKEKAYKKHGIRYVTLDDSDLVDLDRNIPSKLPKLRTGGILK